MSKDRELLVKPYNDNGAGIGGGAGDSGAGSAVLPGNDNNVSKEKKKYIMRKQEQFTNSYSEVNEKEEFNELKFRLAYNRLIIRVVNWALQRNNELDENRLYNTVERVVGLAVYHFARNKPLPTNLGALFYTENQIMSLPKTQEEVTPLREKMEKRNKPLQEQARELRKAADVLQAKARKPRYKRIFSSKTSLNQQATENLTKAGDLDIEASALSARAAGLKSLNDVLFVLEKIIFSDQDKFYELIIEGSDSFKPNRGDVYTKIHNVIITEGQFSLASCGYVDVVRVKGRSLLENINRAIGHCNSEEGYVSESSGQFSVDTNIADLIKLLERDIRVVSGRNSDADLHKALYYVIKRDVLGKQPRCFSYKHSKDRDDVLEYFKSLPNDAEKDKVRRMIIAVLENGYNNLEDKTKDGYYHISKTRTCNDIMAMLRKGLELSGNIKWEERKVAERADKESKNKSWRVIDGGRGQGTKKSVDGIELSEEQKTALAAFQQNYQKDKEEAARAVGTGSGSLLPPFNIYPPAIPGLSFTQANAPVGAPSSSGGGPTIPPLPLTPPTTGGQLVQELATQQLPPPPTFSANGTLIQPPLPPSQTHAAQVEEEEQSKGCLIC